MARRRLKNVKRASSDSDDEQATDTQVENLRRLLAAVNHDLRQPLQAMELLCGVLETKIKDEAALKIILQLEQTLDSAKGILESRLALDRAKLRNFSRLFRTARCSLGRTEREQLGGNVEAGRSSGFDDLHRG